MSIVRKGLLRKHYEEAVEDIEYKSSAFWQAVLHRAFYEPDIYSVTAESSPDGSLRRVDMVVKRYDANNHTLSALLWVECKRQSGNVQEVEEQALDAARRCIQKDNLMWIWAMTTVGVSFRMWFVDASVLELEPIHGSAAYADRRQYIDADSPAASVFPDAIQRIKKGFPLRAAPVVPSQSLDLLAMDDTGQGVSGHGVAVATLPGQDESYYDYDMTEAGPSGDGGDGGDGSGGDESGGRCVEVRVEKTPHTFSHDEYVFRDAKGKKRSTRKEDWEAGKYQGEKAWFFRGKKMTYFSRKKIG